MKLKLLIFFVSFCGVFFGFNLVKADFIMSSPAEPAKYLVDCIQFKVDQQKFSEYVFVAKIVTKHTNEYVNYSDLNFSWRVIDPSRCYNVFRNGSDIYETEPAWQFAPKGETITRWAGVKKSEILKNNDVVNDKLISEEIEKRERKYDLSAPSLYLRDNDKGELTVLLIRKSSPIKYVKQTVEVRDIKIDKYDSLVAVVDDEFEVDLVSGEKKYMNKEDLKAYALQYYPKLEEFPSSAGGNYKLQNENLSGFISAFLFALMQFAIVTILVEFSLFYLFGFRGWRKAVWFAVINLFTFIGGYFLLILLSGKLLEANSSEIIAFVVVELLIVLLEFVLFFLLLRKVADWRKVLVYSVVANVVTAILALIANIGSTWLYCVWGGCLIFAIIALIIVKLQNRSHKRLFEQKF